MQFGSWMRALAGSRRNMGREGDVKKQQSKSGVQEQVQETIVVDGKWTMNDDEMRRSPAVVEDLDEDQRVMVETMEGVKKLVERGVG